MKRTVITNALWLTVGTILLGGLLWQAGPARAAKALAGSIEHPCHLAGAALLFAATTAAFALKWHFMARVAGARTNGRQSLRLFGTMYLVGLFTPARTGEAVVPLLMRGGGRLMGVVLVNRLLESTWTLAAGTVAAVFVLRGNPDRARLWFLVPLLAMFVGMAVLLSRQRLVEAVLDWLRGVLGRLRRFRPAAWLLRQHDERADALGPFHEANERLLRLGPVLVFCLVMLLIWIMMVTGNRLLIGATVPPGTREITFAVVFAVMIVAALAAFVSPIPGGLGLSEVSAVGVFHYLGFPAEGCTLEETARTFAAFLILSRALLYAMTWGLYALGRVAGEPLPAASGADEPAGAETAPETAP